MRPPPVPPDRRRPLEVEDFGYETVLHAAESVAADLPRCSMPRTTAWRRQRWRSTARPRSLGATLADALRALVYRLHAQASVVCRKIVFDKFHIMKHLGDAVDLVP